MQVWSPESPQFDIGELQVAHDLQLVNAAQVLHPVSELKQVWAVHRQLELVGLTQDENLTEKEIITEHTGKREITMIDLWWDITSLKVVTAEALQNKR